MLSSRFHSRIPLHPAAVRECGRQSHSSMFRIAVSSAPVPFPNGRNINLIAFLPAWYPPPFISIDRIGSDWVTLFCKKVSGTTKKDWSRLLYPPVFLLMVCLYEKLVAERNAQIPSRCNQLVIRCDELRLSGNLCQRIGGNRSAYLGNCHAIVLFFNQLCSVYAELGCKNPVVCTRAAAPQHMPRHTNPCFQLCLLLNLCCDWLR